MDRIVMITGAGRGIGAECAVQAAAAGYGVCVNYRADRGAAEAVVARIRAAGGRSIAVGADVSVEDDVVRLFETCDAELGRVTDLINNAGVVAPAAKLETFDAARLHRIFDTNVVGPFLCAREAVRRMSTRHGGSGGVIVNISSAAARLGSPDEYVDYAASKAALDTMTIGLAKEVGAEGIRVVSVRPGLIDTGIHEPGRLVRLAPTVPLGRAGQPAEVAAVVVFLLTARAGFVTGAVIDVTGGR